VAAYSRRTGTQNGIFLYTEPNSGELILFSLKQKGQVNRAGDRRHPQKGRGFANLKLRIDFGAGKLMICLGESHVICSANENKGFLGE